MTGALNISLNVSNQMTVMHQQLSGTLGFAALTCDTSANNKKKSAAHMF